MRTQLTSFSDADLHSIDMAKRGYLKGVPMGGDLPSRPKQSGAPVFMLSAQKDPIGANLDRVQIVKGWLDDKGKVREKVYLYYCLFSFYHLLQKL